MAAPMTVIPDDCRGHIISVVIGYTSAAAANTITITAGLPYLDLTKAHPLICAAAILDEANTDASDSSAMYPSKEMKRGTAADSANEYGIASASTVSLYTTDKNGYAFLTYWAGGSKCT